MAYPIEALNTEAQCDEVIQHLQPLRSALNHQKENKEQIELFLSNASITLEANITAAITEKNSLEAFIASLPAGKTREYYELRLKRVLAKLNRLESWRKQNTMTARFVRQLDIETLHDEITKIDIIISLIQDKKQNLNDS